MAVTAPDPHFWLNERLIAAVEEARVSLKLPDANAGAHRARVALKRARTLARLARLTHPKAALTFNAEARAIMALMSGARDEAAMADAARLAAAGARPATRKILLAVAQTLEARAAQAAPAALRIARAKIERLLMRAKALGPIAPEAMQAGAAALADKAQAAFARAHQHKSEDRRHAWRKRDKDLQVAAKALGSMWPSPLRAKAAGALGMALGAERDLLLLETRLAAEPALAGSKADAKQVLRTVRIARRVMGAHADRLGARAYRVR